MPASNMSTYSPVEAFMPVPAGCDKTLLRYHAALETGVDRDLHQRRGERHLHDGRATGLVTGEVQLLEGGADGVHQRDATTREHALPVPAQRRRQ
jgi:hypothetical protein